MQIIHSSTEQGTALTDFILGVLLLGILFLLYQKSGSLKVTYWMIAFGLLCAASFLGAVAHGFEMSASLNYWLWQPLNLCLGLVIAMFVVAACLDLWGEAASRTTLWIMIAVAIIFYVITVAIPGTFLTFVAYEAIAMLFALGVYIYLASQGNLAGSWMMVLGILITIIAAAIQALAPHGTPIILNLDNNGIFHVVQMFGLLAITSGVLASL